MALGPGTLSSAAQNASFTLTGLLVPIVKTYKYLGIIFSCGGSWTPQLRHLGKRMLSKTAEIAHWCRSHNADLSVAVDLWQLYVFRSAIFGAALMDLCPSGLDLLDRMHRKAARFLCSTSPLVVQCLAIWSNSAGDLFHWNCAVNVPGSSAG